MTHTHKKKTSRKLLQLLGSIYFLFCFALQELSTNFHGHTFKLNSISVLLMELLHTYYYILIIVRYNYLVIFVFLPSGTSYNFCFQQFANEICIGDGAFSFVSICFDNFFLNRFVCFYFLHFSHVSQSFGNINSVIFCFFICK